MAQFLSRTLTALNNMFGLIGSKVSTDQLDLSQVQLVTDVAKLSIAGRGLGYLGSALINLDDTIAIAGQTLSASEPVYAGYNTTFQWRDPLPEYLDVWLLAAWAHCLGTAADCALVDGFQIWHEYDSEDVKAGDALSVARRPLFVADESEPVVITPSATHHIIRPGVVQLLPFRVPRQDTELLHMDVHTSAGVAAATRFTANVEIVTVPQGLWLAP